MHVDILMNPDPLLNILLQVQENKVSRQYKMLLILRP